MSLYAYQFVSRTMENPHNLPDSSNLVLNLCLLRRFPTTDSVTRHVMGSKDCWMRDRKSLASKNTTRHGHGHCVLSQIHSTGVTRIPQSGQGVPLTCATLWCCTTCRTEWFADRKHSSAEDTLCTVPRTHRLSFI
jgi:hypothetical protein